MKLLTADNFSYAELTEAYNQTRVDYMVPMPMNEARLRKYSRIYDVDLAHSWVAVEDDLIMGLAMLGARHGRTWITRLGVLPFGRREGTGTALVEGLISSSNALNAHTLWLEVIKGNKPAHTLFTKFGFVETRELIVARRPPGPLPDQYTGPWIKSVSDLNHEDALILLAHRKDRPNWLNENETFQHLSNLSALVVELEDGSKGWVTYHASLLQLTRIIVEVVSGDPTHVTTAVLHALHTRHSNQDATTENLLDDAVWRGFEAVGYFDPFRRIEMKCPLQDKPTE